MTKDLIERSRKRHAGADAAVIVTTLTLAISLAIAATVVSIGIARADTIVPIANSGGGRLAFALLLGLLIAAMGVLTAAATQGRAAPRRRD
jgi:hypothetical protein